MYVCDHICCFNWKKKLIVIIQKKRAYDLISYEQVRTEYNNILPLFYASHWNMVGDSSFKDSVKVKKNKKSRVMWLKKKINHD